MASEPGKLFHTPKIAFSDGHGLPAFSHILWIINIKMERTPTASIVTARNLSPYFSSGWMFLCVYLVTYLVYRALGWPVHSGDGAHSWAPSLLSVYFALHLFHASWIAHWLWVRWRDTRDSGSALDASTSRLSVALPWILLTLVIAVPGPYLEWPSDPWEHWRRINEWRHCPTADVHSAWTKSGYFLAYSLVGWAAPEKQLLLLRVYYIIVCLLLCWQYYRLGKTVGLEDRWALGFVFFQTFFFGNNIFSFWRYYGLAPTMFAQVAAIASMRVAIEAVELPAGYKSWGRGGLKIAFLGLIAAFSHVQALGMIFLGLLSVAAWRLHRWRAWAPVAMLGFLVICSLGVIQWYPRHPAIDSFCVPQGWIAPWYGFNILSLGSPAQERVLQILGVVGLVNLLAALALWRYRLVVVWLTIVPVLALLLPCFVLPFANQLLSTRIDLNIVTFQRMLFAVPAGLALLALAQSCARWWKSGGVARRLIGTCCSVAVVIGAVTVPAGYPFYNRFWHATTCCPRDVQLDHVVGGIDAVLTTRGDLGGAEVFGGTDPLRSVVSAVSITQQDTRFRQIGQPVTLSIDQELLRVRSTPPTSKQLLIFSRAVLYTPYSQAAQLSGHWPQNQVAADHGGLVELRAAAESNGFEAVRRGQADVYSRKEKPNPTPATGK